MLPVWLFTIITVLPAESSDGQVDRGHTQIRVEAVEDLEQQHPEIAETERLPDADVLRLHRDVDEPEKGSDGDVSSGREKRSSLHAGCVGKRTEVNAEGRELVLCTRQVRNVVQGDP